MLGQFWVMWGQFYVLNHYWTADKKSCSRTQHTESPSLQPFNIQSFTLPPEPFHSVSWVCSSAWHSKEIKKRPCFAPLRAVLGLGKWLKQSAKIRRLSYGLEDRFLQDRIWYICIFAPKPKWEWSGNTTITYCRPTHGTVRKSHRTFIVTIHL